MKKQFLLIAALFLTVWATAQAQTQQGYVKTKGRLANDGSVIAGTRIPNATIQVKDRTPMVSQEDGTFSFPIPATKFYLQNVQKQGYVLTDPDILSKEHIYSTNDLVLVMETPTDQWQDKHAAEKAMREQLQRQVDEQRLELERLKEEQRISDEEYRERLQRIFELYDENDKLVNEMAEAYAKIDYDQLDEHNRLIRQYILAGELKRADSLIHSKGDMDQRIDEFHRHQEANAKETATLAKRQEQLEAAKAGTQKELEDIAQDCYNMFEICKLQHQNDSAAYWIELRARLDTTNYQWMIDAGDFLYEYLADFQTAIDYFHHCLKHAKKTKGFLNKWTSLCYNNIGIVYDAMGLPDSAIYFYQESIRIDTTIFGENSISIAQTYGNIGDTYYDLGEYETSLYYFEKSLNISILLNNATQKARTLNNIGTVVMELDKYDEALELFNEALCIHINESGENSPNVADVYGNIGHVYGQIGDYDKALEYGIKALSTRELVLSPNHPDIALSHNNIGILYLRKGDSTKGLEHLEQALSIRKHLFGENHPSVAMCYNNIGGAYSVMGDTKKELEYYEKALSIFLTIYDEVHPDIAMSYNNIGSIYINLGNYDKALEYLMKALTIRESIHGRQHSLVAFTLYNIGGAYYESGNLTKGMDYFEQCLEIRLATLGEDHPATIKTRKKIAEIQDKLKEQENNQTEE